MRLIITLIFFLPIIAFSQNDTTAKAEKDKHTFDAQIGIPLGSNGTMLFGGSYAYTHHLFQMRYLIISESFVEKAFLYGYRSDASKGTLSIGLSAGIGHLSGGYWEYSQYVSGISAIGIALQLATFYPVNEYFGGGLTLHTNVNEKKP